MTDINATVTQLPDINVSLDIVGSTTLNGINDVEISNPQNNEQFVYNSASEKWENSTVGSLIWGNITGTLSNQIDLQAELDTKEDDLTFSTGLTRTVDTITINDGEIVHQSLSGAGINTHIQIDSHIADITTNPHSVDATSVGLGNVSNVSTDDTAYNAISWDTNSDAATKNAIRDKVETMDTAIGLNTTHKSSDGSDHSFINQDVTTTGTPTFGGLIITGGTIQLNSTDFIKSFNSTSTSLGIATGSIGTTNTLIGRQAGDSNTANQVTAIGYTAATGNTQNSLVAIGEGAGHTNTGTSGTFVGLQAGYQNSGDTSTFIGNSAGQSNNSDRVTAIGYKAGQLQTGQRGSFLGYNSGWTNSGEYGTGVGGFTLQQNTGDRNTALGYSAGYLNTGSDSVFLGYGAGSSNSSNNVFIVKQSPVNATALISGDFSTGDVNINNNLTLGGTVDGIDIATDVAANTLKVTNATHTGDVTGTTALTIGVDKVNDTHIDFGTGANQVSTADLPEQTNLYYTESRVTANSSVAANTAKVTNVSTNLSEGTSTETTVDINSSDGTNATLVSASTLRAGLLTKSKFDEIVLNNAKVTNATHTGDVTGSTTLTIGVDKVLDSHINFGTGANQVSTADVPEQTNLYYTEARVNANTNVSSNTTHRGLTNNPHSVDKTDVGLSNVANVDTTNASNISSGTLSSSLLPPIALTTVQLAANQTAQLALTTEEGDVVVRTDEEKSYMRNAGLTGTMTDFTELQSPTDLVLSVNGESGTVILTTGDISEDINFNYVSDAELVVLGNTSGTNTGDQDISGIGTNTTAIALNTTHRGLTNNPHSVTATQVGLGSVSNVTTDDTAYNATSWNTNLDSATKNAIRDKIETMDTAIGLNTSKVTNVSTDLSEGTSTETTVNVDSSDGTNATLVSASVTRAGLLTKAKYDEIVANTSKVTNATHTGDVTGDTTLTIGVDKVKDTMIDFGTGANQVSTADVPEQTNLYYTEARVDANSSVVANTAKTGITTQQATDITTNNAKVSYTDSAAVSLNTAKVTNANHTGDATGATALTLATVNSNVGSFTNADITVNAKGLITAATNGSGGGGITWNEVTGTSQSGAVDNGYITNNAGLVTVTLPDTAALGSTLRIAGNGAGGWKLAQNASEIVHFGNSTTTTGVGGSLASTLSKDAIELVCVVANTEWSVISSVGNITIV